MYLLPTYCSYPMLHNILCNMDVPNPTHQYYPLTTMKIHKFVTQSVSRLRIHGIKISFSLSWNVINSSLCSTHSYCTRMYAYGYTIQRICRYLLPGNTYPFQISSYPLQLRGLRSEWCEIANAYVQNSWYEMYLLILKYDLPETSLLSSFILIPATSTTQLRLRVGIT